MRSFWGFVPSFGVCEKCWSVMIRRDHDCKRSTPNA